jgi:DNA-binding response OmpR family regulator
MKANSDFKILIVDDDHMNGEFLQKRLEKRGYNSDYVSSGTACLEIIGKENYDLVLLDIMMPDVSGTEVLEHVRTQFNNFELPIIMVTAKDESSDIVGALKLGANDYLVKPINMDIATARINTQLQIKDLIEVSLKSRQVATINTMVTTLNHEINNPLAIAIGNLSIAKKNIDHVKIEKAIKALDRITEIVKKIDSISKSEMEEVNYSSTVNMFKI